MKSKIPVWLILIGGILMLAAPLLAIVAGQQVSVGLRLNCVYCPAIYPPNYQLAIQLWSVASALAVAAGILLALRATMRAVTFAISLPSAIVYIFSSESLIVERIDFDLRIGPAISLFATTLSFVVIPVFFGSILALFYRPSAKPARVV